VRPGRGFSGLRATRGEENSGIDELVFVRAGGNSTRRHLVADHPPHLTEQRVGCIASPAVLARPLQAVLLTDSRRFIIPVAAAFSRRARLRINGDDRGAPPSATSASEAGAYSGTCW